MSTLRRNRSAQISTSLKLSISSNWPAAVPCDQASPSQIPAKVSNPEPKDLLAEPSTPARLTRTKRAQEGDLNPENCSTYLSVHLSVSGSPGQPGRVTRSERVLKTPPTSKLEKTKQKLSIT